MKRRLAVVTAAVAAALLIAAPVQADSGDPETDKHWVCLGITPLVDLGLCPGNPLELLPNPLLPDLPFLK